ncbi:MAG: class I SAM-dependent methyltransferase [Acidobacteria bacterium]|nr:class I SAM-dependent methyltransferase [Acidobacteriota bacterium]
MSNFQERLAALDISLFDAIQSQSTDDDRRSLLAVELAAGDLKSSYTYLEIGSYLGGSIQPHLLDERCGRIYSIDKRPEAQPDARGFDWVYQNNSTERMLELLRGVSPDIDKITTIDGDTAEISPTQIAEKVDLCFIDGEHTDEAVLRDFRFCLEVLAERGAVMFHDSQITYNGIADCTAYLDKQKIAYKAYPLPSCAFVVEIGDFPLHREPCIADLFTRGHLSYLWSLNYNDNYRRFANRFPFGFLRRTLIKFRGSNVSR